MANQRGIDDVLGWYESMPDHVWSQWVAYDMVEPVGCDWERHATIAAMLEAIMAAIANPNLEKEDRIKPRPVTTFLPTGFEQKKRTKRKRATLAHQLALVAQVFGGRKVGDDNQ